MLSSYGILACCLGIERKLLFGSYIVAYEKVHLLFSLRDFKLHRETKWALNIFPHGEKCGVHVLHSAISLSRTKHCFTVTNFRCSFRNEDN